MKLHFFCYCLNKNSHPQPEKGRFILDKNLAAQNIEILRFRCMTKIFNLFDPEFCMKIIEAWHISCRKTMKQTSRAL